MPVNAQEQSPSRPTAPPDAGWTAFGPAAGLADLRRFVTFRLVPAVQGGGVEALADGIAVGTEWAAVTIRRTGDLLFSNGGSPRLDSAGAMALVGPCGSGRALCCRGNDVRMESRRPDSGPCSHSLTTEH